MDAGELARWTRFAAKGGIGKCTAIQDCVAERAEDLMFLKVSLCFAVVAPLGVPGGRRSVQPWTDVVLVGGCCWMKGFMSFV